jgi:hypothetical protein
LAGEIKDGERVKVGLGKDELTFKVAGASARAA